MDSGAVYNFIDEIDYTEDSSYKRDSSSTDMYITLSFFKGAILTQSCHYQYSAETMTSPEDLQMPSDVFNHKVAGYFIITITTNMSITSRIDYEDIMQFHDPGLQLKKLCPSWNICKSKWDDEQRWS